MPYLIAWIVIGVAALLGLGALTGLTRRLGSSLWRKVLVALIVFWWLLPAPVPGYEGSFAPAFVVLIFEGLFQTDGAPAVAAAILAAGSLVALAVALLVHAVLRKRRRTGALIHSPADL